MDKNLAERVAHTIKVQGVRIDELYAENLKLKAELEATQEDLEAAYDEKNWGSDG
jgi:hypothetical protein